MLPSQVIGRGLWIKARGLGQVWTRPAGRAPVYSAIGNILLCVASSEQTNSHSSGASYHGKQGYNMKSVPSVHLSLIALTAEPDPKSGGADVMTSHND